MQQERKKQLTAFTLWGFLFTTLTFWIPWKMSDCGCVNIRVTGKKTISSQISLMAMLKCCEAGDGIQPGRRVQENPVTGKLG